jgi:hypothetical protein
VHNLKAPRRPPNSRQNPTASSVATDFESDSQLTNAEVPARDLRGNLKLVNVLEHEAAGSRGTTLCLDFQYTPSSAVRHIPAGRPVTVVVPQPAASAPRRPTLPGPA